MFGGVEFDSSNGTPVTVSNVEVFDTKTRSWKSARSLLRASGHHSSVLVPSLWFDEIWGETVRFNHQRWAIGTWDRYSGTTGSE